MHTSTNWSMPNEQTTPWLKDYGGDGICSTESVWFCRLSLYGSYLESSKAVKDSRFSTMMLQWVMIDGNGCCKLCNECEVVGSWSLLKDHTVLSRFSSLGCFCHIISCRSIISMYYNSQHWHGTDGRDRGKRDWGKECQLYICICVYNS